MRNIVSFIISIASVSSLVSPNCAIFKQYCIDTGYRLKSSTDLKILQLGTTDDELQSMFPDCQITLIEEGNQSLGIRQLECQVYDVVHLQCSCITIEECNKIICEAARILKYGGCFFATTNHDTETWTRAGNKRFAYAGLVQIRIQKEKNFNLIMASRSRFEPIEYKEQPTAAKGGKEAKKASVLLMLADLPIVLIRLFLIYSIIQALVQLAK